MSRACRQTAPLAALNPPPPLFARVNVLTFEEGNPDSKLAATLNWNGDGAFGATFRATRYGEALDPDPRLAGTAAAPIGAQDAVIGAQTARRPRRPLRADRASAHRDRRREPARRVSRRLPGRAQRDRQHAVLELRAVRALRAVRVRARDVRVLSWLKTRTAASRRRDADRPARRRCRLARPATARGIPKASSSRPRARSTHAPAGRAARRPGGRPRLRASV